MLFSENGGEGGINGAFRSCRLAAAFTSGRPLAPHKDFTSFESDTKSDSLSAQPLCFYRRSLRIPHLFYAIPQKGLNARRDQAPAEA